MQEVEEFNEKYPLSQGIQVVEDSWYPAGQEVHAPLVESQVKQPAHVAHESRSPGL